MPVQYIPSYIFGGLLQPLLILKRMWEDISIDFVEGLPCSDDFNAILVVVDHLSAYVHFIVISHLYSAKKIVTMFIKEAVQHHGFPNSTVLDQDNFLSIIFGLSCFVC